MLPPVAIEWVLREAAEEENAQHVEGKNPHGHGRAANSVCECRLIPL
jgi:hypothetical protein